MLIDVAFRNRRPSCVPLLTQRHKAPCLAWASQHRRWTLNEWENIVWSDELRVQSYRMDGCVRVSKGSVLGEPTPLARIILVEDNYAIFATLR
ncbi:hypothetical protein TNCV_325901 [Trichonephila clavipes]|nr:hypothetical protein TNCV_325901 [Trichonephila clavipes]